MAKRWYAIYRGAREPGAERGPALLLAFSRKEDRDSWVGVEPGRREAARGDDPAVRRVIRFGERTGFVQVWTIGGLARAAQWVAGEPGRSAGEDRAR